MNNPIEKPKTLREKIAIIEHCIPDKNLQCVVFDFDNEYEGFLTDDRITIKYFNNLLVLCSFIIYKGYILWKRSLNEDIVNNPDDSAVTRNTNSKNRLYSLLDICYDVKKFDLDFIENLIINIQIDDSSLDPQNSFLKTIGLKDFFDFDSSITKYIYQLKKSKLSARAATDFSFDDLLNVFKMCRFLRDSRIEFSDKINNKAQIGNGILSCVLKHGQVFDTRELGLDELILIDRKDCYYLEDFTFRDCRLFAEDNQKRQSIGLNYLSFTTPSQLVVELSNTDRIDPNESGEPPFKNSDSSNALLVSYDAAIESFLIKYDVINLDKVSESTVYFKDYISFNNKYIKNFALIISDTIKAGTKKAIYRVYGKKYSDVFKRLYVKSFYNNDSNSDINNINHYRWDEIIIFLLLEEGIYNMLSLLLKYEEYEDFIKAFRSRFGRKVDHVIAQNAVINNPTVNLKLENADNIRKCKIEALIVLATKLLTAKEINYDLLFSAPSVFDIIQDIEQKYASKKLSVREKIVYLTGTVIDTASFLDVFYFGLLQYFKRLSIQELLFTEEWNPSYDDYIEEKTNLLDEFKYSADNRKLIHREVYELYTSIANGADFSSSALSALDHSFKLLYETNNCSHNKQPDNEAFYTSIGKRSIFDKNKMRHYHQALKTCLVEIGKDINSTSALNELYCQIKSFMNYIGGVSEEDKCQNYNTAVFPIVCFYTNGIMSRDGYRYSYMVTSRKKRIKMVTSDELRFGQTYYCLPNIKRIADAESNKDSKYESIWINPIIIPQNGYSNINTAKFSDLTLSKDFEKAAELLYCTDVRIYSGLFGSLETAKKILPKLFEEKNSVFNKKYFYVAKTGETVVGLVSLYNELPSWNSDIIEKCFAEAHIAVTDDMRASYEYFKDTFGDSYGHYSTICDLSVDVHYRNKGFAKFLLYNVIQKVEDFGGDVTISVYSDNIPAIKLYSSMGFFPYIEDYDTRGSDLKANRYFKMIRYWEDPIK